MWEVSWRLNRLQHIDSQFPWLLQHFFLILLAAQPGVLRAQPSLGAVSHYSILSPTWLTPTNWTSCRTGLYHCLTSTCFLWASHLHPIQPVHSQGYTLISSTGCTSSLIDGWVEGQYVTQGVTNIKRISTRKNEQRIQTNTYILTFNKPRAPKEVKIGYCLERVEQYVPAPLRNFKCQKGSL